MASTDPVEAFEHDHAALNEQVLRLGPLLAALERGDLATASLARYLVSLRDDLFLHFAKEEDGLFPYLVDVARDLEPAVGELISMHDEICGALARIVHVMSDEPRPDVLLPLYDRFEVAYARHSLAEHKLLETAAARLTGAQRSELAAMVAGV